MTAFAARLRESVDLGSVSDDLMHVVQAAFEPMAAAGLGPPGAGRLGRLISAGAASPGGVSMAVPIGDADVVLALRRPPMWDFRPCAKGPRRGWLGTRCAVDAAAEEGPAMFIRFRWVLWPILVIGIALVVAPLALSMPSKTSAGQKMLDDFHSIMQAAAVRKTVAYDKVFVDLRQVAVTGVSAAAEAPALFSTLASPLHVTETQLAAMLSGEFPAMAKLLGALPALVPVFSNVPPGLTWYAPIVKTMQDNVQHYAKVDSLPNFNLFTWFFVAPGAILVLCAALGVWGAYRPLRRDISRLSVTSTETRAA